MNKKKAKLQYKHNSFDIIEEGNFVVCAVSGKEISLENLTYWNVELQEAYFSPLEVNERYKKIRVKNPNMIVVPMLKNVEETIAGIIINIEKGFEIPPVKYSRDVNWIKS